MSAVNNLPQMIRDAIEQRELTYRAIAQRAQAAGYVLSHSTVSVYASGKSRQYSREKLEAIAVGLGMNKDVFTASASMPTLGAPLELPAESAMLDPHERDAVRRVVEAFIETKTRREKVMGNAEHPAPITVTGDDDPAQDEQVSKLHPATFGARPEEDEPESDTEYYERKYGKSAHPKQDIPHDAPLEEQ